MMAKPLTPLGRWSRTSRRGVPGHVGRFYEMLSARILLARPCQTTNADLLIRSLALGCEVKAGDNNNLLRIPIRQLEQHTSNTGEFPATFEYFFYCLFCYRNKTRDGERGNRRRSRLSTCGNEIEVYSILAENTDKLYVLDHRILHQVRAVYGSRRGDLPGQPDGDTISIRRKLLDIFRAENAPFVFGNLSLNATNWIIRERRVEVAVSIGLFCHQMAIEVIEVLPREVVAEFDRTIRLPATARGVSHRRLKIV